MAGRKGVSFPPTRFFRKEIRGCVFFANRLRAGAAYPRSGSIDFILFDVKLFAPKNHRATGGVPCGCFPRRTGRRLPGNLIRSATI